MSVLLAAWLSSAAHATTGLAWQWPAEGHRFLMAARVDLPRIVTLPAERNEDLRTAGFDVTLVTACVPEVPGPKKGFRLSCKLEDVALRVDPDVAMEDDHIDSVLGELDTKLTGATVELVTDAEGHVKLVDLEGFDTSRPREREQHAISRLVLMRVFALLDFELPKGGDDKGAAWRVSGSLLAGYPSELGVTGGAPLDTVVTATEGSVVLLRQKGAGMVQSGEQQAVAGVARPAFIWDVAIDGEARFDTASGRLLERSYVVDAIPTASSLDGVSAPPYVQRARLVALGPAERPTLPATGVLAE